MVRLTVKPYIVAKSSPSGKSPESGIQGEDMDIDSEDYKIRPEQVKQEIISKFTDWLTHPKKGGYYPNRARIMNTAVLEISGLPEEKEETEAESLWREASRTIEDEAKFRRIYGELSEELGRTPRLVEVEARL